MNFLVRNWRSTDTFEPELAEELNGIRLTPQLVWVAVEKDGEADTGQVYGYLLGAAGHSVGWLLRLKVLPERSDLTALALVHRAIADCQKAGLAGFTVLLGENESEMRLRGMMARAGAVEVPCGGVWSTLRFSKSDAPRANSGDSEAIPANVPSQRPQPSFIREVR